MSESHNLLRYEIITTCTCQSNLPFCVDDEKGTLVKPYRGLPQASHVMNDLPVIGCLWLRKELWDRQGKTLQVARRKWVAKKCFDVQKKKRFWRKIVSLSNAETFDKTYKTESSLTRIVPKLLFMPLLLRNWITAIPCYMVFHNI